MVFNISRQYSDSVLTISNWYNAFWFITLPKRFITVEWQGHMYSTQQQLTQHQDLQQHHHRQQHVCTTASTATSFARESEQQQPLQCFLILFTVNGVDFLKRYRLKKNNVR